MSGFVHLHVHTEYSLLDSLVRIPELMVAVADAGMPAVAMTDAASLHAAPLFMREARRQGLRPIFGVEFEMAPRAALAAGATGPDLVVIAETAEGWLSLVRLVSESQLQSAAHGRPVLSESTLFRHTQGLILLTGGNNGEISRLCRAGRAKEAVETLRRLSEAFGRDQVFVELQNQRLAGQAELIASLREVARQASVRCVATNNVHYLRRDQAEAHRCLRCVRRGIARAEDGTSYSSEFYLKGPEEMAAAFADAPEALETTIEIAQRCQLNPWPPDTSRFPRYRPPDGAAVGGSADELRRLAWAGFRRRWAAVVASPTRTAAAERRLDREIEAAIRARVANYLLVHADLVRAARERGLAVTPSRAAAASSLLAWSLELTDVLALRWDLPPERFLNPDHPALPELSLDVAPHHRASLMALVRERYGEDCVVHAGTRVVFGARSAVREVARVLGVPADQVEELIAILGDTVRSEPRLDRADVRDRLLARAGRWSELVHFAAMFEGLPRTWAAHPTALVLADSPVGSIVPLYRTADGDAVTQFEVRDLPRFGLVRTDVPASRTAALLGEAGAALRASSPEQAGAFERVDGREVDVAQLIRRGDVAGIPGLELPAVAERCRKWGARRVEDLAPWLAILAAESSALAAELEAALEGRRPPERVDASVQPLLAPTGGMLLYEEQAVQVLQRLARLPPEFADLARRAESARDEELRRRVWKQVRNGARGRGLPDREIEAVWAAVLDCFHRRVSLARGAVLATHAWRAAWLKAREPLVFYAAALAAEAGDPERARPLLREVIARGVPLLGPDANESMVTPRATAGAIRLGWISIRGVRPEAAAMWVAEREQRGPFRDLADFAQRLAGVALGRNTLAHLVRAGAFDSFGAPRAQLLAELDAIWTAASAARDVRHGQTLLFNETCATGSPPSLTDVLADRWAAERELLGVVISPHPLRPWEWWLRTAVPAQGESDGMSLATGVPLRVADELAPGVTLDMFDGVEQIGIPPGWLPTTAWPAEPVVVPVRRERGGLTAVGRWWPLEAAVRRVVEVCVSVPAGGEGSLLHELVAAARAHPGPTPLRLLGAPLRSARPPPVGVGASLVRALERCAGPRSVRLVVDLSERRT
ncbi:MAG: DNA polymerase III subunit alpha [Kiritimatiellae bacterium]|nr:DNA polymerase III subunit alpha [Kiritimatiellia bacterium]